MDYSYRSGKRLHICCNIGKRRTSTCNLFSKMFWEFIYRSWDGNQFQSSRIDCIFSLRIWHAERKFCNARIRWYWLCCEGSAWEEISPTTIYLSIMQYDEPQKRLFPTWVWLDNWINFDSYITPYISAGKFEFSKFGELS